MWFSSMNISNYHDHFFLDAARLELKSPNITAAMCVLDSDAVMPLGIAQRSKLFEHPIT